ncbi:MAG: HlyC/CorC family transporter [Porticoccaceae bacterium]|nr:HlyC/CorC family transporter [Porticoccaceae bacterium]MEA3299817.1 HlyC/CorC family transporter [Pseudomonadota bacterium]HLS99602.1 HlyC/CorC family transporter [Porticoccaceae bacterium]
MNDTPLWLLFSVLALLLTISAFFSGSETGMMSINRYRLKHLAKKHRGARRVNRLLRRPDRLIGVILIGNNLANNFAAIVAAAIAVKLYGQGAEIAAGVVLTIVMLIVAEVTPKTIAALHPERIAFPASYLLKPLLKLLYPAVWLVNHASNGILRLFGINPENVQSDALSKDELRTVVDESSDAGATEHQGMLINILDLEKVTVNDIMVPRNEIVGLNLEEDIETLVDQIVATEYTRLPIFEGDINSVTGFLHMRRVNRLLRRGESALTKEAIKRFAREPYFVPESTPLHLQLVNFQKNKRRIALVVDEYGEILGLVTLEDILEEIVGKFTTNYAEDEQDIVAHPDRSYTIDASINIRDINKAIHWHLPTDGPKTLNGLLLEKLEHIPEGNVCLEFAGYRFETLALSDKMIDSVLARRLPRAPVAPDKD